MKYLVIVLLLFGCKKDPVMHWVRYEANPHDSTGYVKFTMTDGEHTKKPRIDTTFQAPEGFNCHIYSKASDQRPNFSIIYIDNNMVVNKSNHVGNVYYQYSEASYTIN